MDANATPKMRTVHLTASYGKGPAIQDINLDFRPQTVTAVIGPSGCGKSTLIRCLNRMHETDPRRRSRFCLPRW